MGPFRPIGDILLALLLLLLLSRVLGLVARRFKVSSMVGEVMGGLLLSPLLLNLLNVTEGSGASSDLGLFADFAIIVIMFHSGLFTDFSSFRRNRVTSIVIGTMGVVVSFGMVFVVSFFILGFSFDTSLFLGAIISNSAIEVCATLLRDTPNEKLRAVVIGASFVDDIMAVFVLGVVLTYVGAPTEDVLPLIDAVGFTPDRLLTFLITSAKVVLFLLSVSFIFSRLFPALLDRFMGRGFEVLLTIGFLTAFSLGVISNWVGLHEVIGVYLAGLILSRWGILPDPMLTRGIAMMKFKETLSSMMYALFSPIFFGFVGLLLGSALAVLGGDLLGIILGVLLLTSVALLGKVIGCGSGARLRKIAPTGAFLIGIAMGGRGALEFILIQSGYEADLLTQDQFITVILVTLMTILLTPILYRLTKARLREESV